MKRKKIIIISMVVIIFLVAGTMFSWHIVNRILHLKAEQIIAEHDSIDYAALRRQQAYEIGEDVLFFINFYNEGGNPTECKEMLEMDYDALKEFKDDEILEHKDRTVIDAMALMTSELKYKVIAHDYDTSEEIENIKGLMEYLKEKGLPEEKK